MKKLFFIFGLMTLCFAPAHSVLATDSIFETATDKLKTTSERAGLGDPQSTQNRTRQLAQNIINTVIGLLGVIAVLLIVYAGALWLTASGNDAQVTKAKGIIRSTIIGVLIVGFAYAITAFVLNLLLTRPPAQEANEETEQQAAPAPVRVE